MDNKSYISTDSELYAGLWVQFKAGIPEAFGRLAELNYRALYNYGIRFSSDDEFVRDCIQELFLELWERRTFLSETAFVKAYLFKGLRHKIIKESIRLKRFQEPKDLLFEPDSADFPIESQIIESEQLNQQVSQLGKIIQHLSKRQKEIIYLRFYQNLENEEISHIMGLGRQSVSNLLYRTLKDIKEIWLPAEFLWLSFIFLL